jgi:SAM-dependent MidA family methyltransferase
MEYSVNDFNLGLCDAIAHRIAESPDRRITFAEYMDSVLYHPQHGYYAINAANIGPQGDFFTSPHLGTEFGELLAEQFVQMWEILERPIQFTLLEMGVGQGLLTADILGYLYQHYRDVFDSLEYIIVERSDALRKQQQHRLQKFGNRLRWVTLEEIPTGAIAGCCFSNELVDALPVHQFVVEKRQLREIYVTTQEASRPSPLAPPPSFVEVTGEPSTSRLAEYFDLVKIDLSSKAYPDGYRSEINLAALDWLSMVANSLQRGYLLTIDYGYPSERYYSPVRRQGTLQCYYHHLRHDNPYINVGRQDITAHVDFTALEVWGEVCGLDKLGFTQQGLFLMALGLGERIAALSTSSQAMVEAQGITHLLQRRESLHQLIDPLGLGGFGVLVQSKGLTEAGVAHPLKGLMPPEIIEEGRRGF